MKMSQSFFLLCCDFLTSKIKLTQSKLKKLKYIHKKEYLSNLLILNAYSLILHNVDSKKTVIKVIV